MHLYYQYHQSVTDFPPSPADLSPSVLEIFDFHLIYHKRIKEVKESKLTASLISFLCTQANKAKRVLAFKRAESYVNEYKRKEREEIRLRRQAKNTGEFYVPAEPKVYFVIRLRGSVGLYKRLSQFLMLIRRFTQQYQRDRTQATKDLTAPPPASDQQRCLRQGHQGHRQHAPNHRAIRYIRRSQPQVRP